MSMTRAFVLTCCKNNDGELRARTAWVRKNGLFAPDTGFNWEAGFNWEEWDSVGKAAKRTFEMAEIVARSHGAISMKNLASELVKNGVPQRTAYRWISQAEEKRLIKFCKGRDGYVPY